MLKLLIADDEKNIRKMMEATLQTQYTLDFAQDGAEAIAMLQKNTYELALLDIKMPIQSGMDVLRTIRMECIDTPILMMTAYGTIGNAVEAMKLGAVDFLSKPFTPGEIRQKIADVITDKPKTMELEQRLSIARQLIRAGDHKNAKKHLDRLLEKNDDDAQVHNLLGVVAESSHETEHAQRHYRAALSLDPTYKAADYNLQRTIRMGFVPLMDALLGDEHEKDRPSPLLKKSFY